VTGLPQETFRIQDREFRFGFPGVEFNLSAVRITA